MPTGVELTVPEIVAKVRPQAVNVERRVAINRTYTILSALIKWKAVRKGERQEGKRKVITWMKI